MKNLGPRRSLIELDTNRLSFSKRNRPSEEDMQTLEDIGENFCQEHPRHPRMILKDNLVHLSHCCTVVMIDGENCRLSETHRLEIIRQRRSRNECGNNEEKSRKDLIAAIEKR